MAEFRRDPHTEGRAAFGELRRALGYAVLAAAVWVSVNSYWPAKWVQPDKPRRDRIVLIICGLLVVVALWNLADGLVHTVRWRRARRWERMLGDPATAYLVPPLAAHLKSVPSAPSGFVVLGGAVLLGAVSLGLTLYGTLALAGRVPAYRDVNGPDQSGILFVGLSVGLLTIGAARQVRKWHVARTRERLWSDAAIAPAPKVAADVAVRRSSSIPRLNVVFGGVEAGPLHRAIGGRVGRSSNDPLHILYLRLFDNIGGTKRFLNGPWRLYGYVYLLASATEFDADELESAEDSGSVASLFISTPGQLEAAIVRRASERHDYWPRSEGFLKRWKRLRWITSGEQWRYYALSSGGLAEPYPVVKLPCHGRFWKSAVDLLLARMDLVALDLSGYRPQHAGTRYELQRVIDRYPIDRVTLLAGTASDREFLTAQVEAAWTQMADGSPNAGKDPRTVHVAVL